jgi:hypothetical protein
VLSPDSPLLADLPMSPVPELSSIYLVASGLLSLGVSRLRKN